MKKIILTAAVLFSSSAFAGGIWSGVFDEDYNPEMYDISSFSHAKVFPTAVQPGIGESYGSVLLDLVKNSPNSPPQKGENESYGSVLFDVGAW